MAVVSDIWMPIELRVGDRVRVRVSLECRYCFDPDFPKGHAEAMEDDGREGRIIEIEDNANGRCICRWADREDPSHPDHVSHNILVKWDDRRPYDDTSADILGEDRFDNIFAASELILLERGNGTIWWVGTFRVGVYD